MFSVQVGMGKTRQQGMPLVRIRGFRTYQHAKDFATGLAEVASRFEDVNAANFIRALRLLFGRNAWHASAKTSMKAQPLTLVWNKELANENRALVDRANATIPVVSRMSVHIQYSR